MKAQRRPRHGVEPGYGLGPVGDHLACAAKPLHTLAARLERDHRPLRTQLPLIVRLAEEALPRTDRQPAQMLSQIHLAATLLRDAVLSHFDHEEALLFPSIRLLEDGAGKWALDLRQLIPELRREHHHIEGLLAQLRIITHGFATGGSPLVRTLFAALEGIARDLDAHFAEEEQTLLPRALALQHDGAVRPPEV